jgi:hypothetical protein
LTLDERVVLYHVGGNAKAQNERIDHTVTENGVWNLEVFGALVVPEQRFGSTSN